MSSEDKFSFAHPAKSSCDLLQKGANNAFQHGGTMSTSMSHASLPTTNIVIPCSREPRISINQKQVCSVTNSAE